MNNLEKEAKQFMKWKNISTITATEYQRSACKTAIFPKELGVQYLALGLTGEAGEVANKVKKIMRDGNFDRQAIADEVGDCLWYIAALCRDLNVELKDLADANLRKLYGRKERGTLSGSGDKR